MVSKAVSVNLKQAEQGVAAIYGSELCRSGSALTNRSARSTAVDKHWFLSCQ